MGNAIDNSTAAVIRKRVELLMNYCHTVLRSQDEHLRAAMMEYRQSLMADRAA
jgi:hypothetical protein